MCYLASPCLSLLLTRPVFNPGRPFRRGIFSKPSPSSVGPNLQPALHSILARSRCAELGPLEVEDFLLLRYRERDRERAQFTKAIELQIGVYIVSLLLPLPVCMVLFF